MLRRALLMASAEAEPIEFQGVNLIPKAWKAEETISDGWSKIVASCQDGTYLSKYSLGDTKIADFGIQGLCMMQIVAFDQDLLSTGSGTAPITWASRHTLLTPQKYPSHLKNLKSLLPQGLQDAIRKVKIEYYYRNSSSHEYRFTTCDLFNYHQKNQYTNFPTHPRITGLTPQGPTTSAFTEDNYAYNYSYGGTIYGVYGDVSSLAASDLYGLQAMRDMFWHVAPCFCT